MSLDLLKERFGHSISTDKKEVDKKKLNEMFNSNPMGKLESFKAQHQGELEEKDRIIENLESETSNLATQVLNLEKEKSTLLEELNNSKWMENTIASKTKKIYEDKIKKMNIVDWNEFYWEINGVTEPQLIAGHPNYRHNIKATAHRSRLSSLQIEERPK